MKVVEPIESGLPPVVHHKVEPIVVAPVESKPPIKCCSRFCCRKKKEPATDIEEAKGPEQKIRVIKPFFGESR
jgi:hypothetical protein